MTETERLAIQLEAKHALSVNLIKENKELRTRVAELEKDLDDKAVSYCNGEILQLKTRLSNLLKASEGMEKALERIVEIPDQTDYEEDPCGQVNAMHEKATKALADFRALKEMK